MHRIKKVCVCLLVICMTVISLKGMTDLSQRKSSDFKYRPFFEQEEDFDIIFLGTSHVINGIFPMELWNDYGFVSYNFGGHSNQLAVSYWVLKNVLDYTTPRLAVIDCLTLGTQTKTSQSFDYVHLSMDAFPPSITKWQAVSDLLDDQVMNETAAAGNLADAAKRTKMSLLWDYSVYHSRWNELSADDFMPGSSREKGAESRIAVSTPADVKKIASNQKLEGDTAGITYLRKILDECKSRGIEVLLVYLPFPASESEQKEANRVYDIAKNYDVSYINFLDMDLTDYQTDCYDPASHLNPSGAKKVTDYLGDFISTHYDIPDRRQDEAYKSWHDSYADYKNYKAGHIKNQQALDIYLMLLADKNYNLFVEIRNPAVWKNKHYKRLLQNLGIDTGKITKDTDAFVLKGGRHEDSLKNFSACKKKEYQTALGTIRHVKNEDQSVSVYLDDSMLYSVDEVQNESMDIRIAVFDKDTMEVTDQAGFCIQDREDIADDYLSVTGVVR